jgi:hypothetical protein
MRAGGGKKRHSSLIFAELFPAVFELVSTAGTLILVSGTIATHSLNLMVAFIGFLLVFN